MSAMRVGFNARLLDSPTLRGWNRYTVNLIENLPALGVMPVLFMQRDVHSDHKLRWENGSYEIHYAPKMQTTWFDQCWIPNACRNYQIDILHSTFNFGLPSRLTKSCKQVLTLHDAIDYVFYRDKQSLLAKMNRHSILVDWMHRSSRDAADRILTVSRHAKEDIVRRFKIVPEKIDVTYEAADDNFRKTRTRRNQEEIFDKFGIKKPYFFYVGGWEERKNVPFLVEAFAQAKLQGHELVLAGGNAQQKKLLIALSKELNISNSIRMLDWVPDEDLPALYQGSTAFVYPSHYEGFGLQLCEAMASGCPILAANSSCLPEILGDGGELFGLDETSTLSKLMHRVATDVEYRVLMIEKASTRSTIFSWKENARQTHECYEKTLER